MASRSFWPNTSREEWRQDSADHTVCFRGMKLTIENGDQTIMVMCCGDMLLYIYIHNYIYIYIIIIIVIIIILLLLIITITIIIIYIFIHMRQQYNLWGCPKIGHWPLMAMAIWKGKMPRDFPRDFGKWRDMTNNLQRVVKATWMFFIPHYPTVYSREWVFPLSKGSKL